MVRVLLPVVLLLIAFTAVNVSVLVLRRDPVDHDHFTAPTFAPIVGVAASIYLIADNEAEVFVQEVAQCLAAWKKSTPHPKPKVQGITGREYEFDFDVDGTLVLAISSRHQSTSAALHKLVDVKGLPANQALKTMIIIDDRRDAKAAKSESMILSSVSNVIGMHQLQRNAGLPAQMQ